MNAIKQAEDLVGNKPLSHHVVNIFARHGDFSGRTTREEYWSFVLFYNVVMLVISASIFALPLQIIAAVFALISVPLVSVGVRRLHDVGRSGKWLILLLISCFSGFMTLAYQAANDPMVLVWSFLCVVSAIASYLPVRWLNSPGEQSANRFGDVPSATDKRPISTCTAQ